MIVQNNRIALMFLIICTLKTILCCYLHAHCPLPQLSYSDSSHFYSDWIPYFNFMFFFNFLWSFLLPPSSFRTLSTVSRCHFNSCRRLTHMHKACVNLNHILHMKENLQYLTLWVWSILLPIMIFSSVFLQIT